MENFCEIKRKTTYIIIKPPRPSGNGNRFPARHAAWRAHPSRPMTAPTAAIPTGTNLDTSKPSKKLSNSDVSVRDTGTGFEGRVAALIGIFTTIAVFEPGVLVSSVVFALIVVDSRVSRN